MSDGWVLYEQAFDMTVVLKHPNGAKATFHYGDVAELKMRGSLPRDPFQAFAYMIQEGLRPFKVEGMPMESLPDMLPRITYVGQ